MSSNEGRVSALMLLLSALALAVSEAGAQVDATEDAAAAQAGAPSSEGLASLRRTRDAFVLAEDLEAALGPAQELVDRSGSTDDSSHPDDLIRLAAIQAGLDDFEAAELNFLEAIELIKQAEGEFSITLMAPYQALGRMYTRNRQFPEAVTALEQAQHVTQRNLGLFNVTQADLIDDLTTAQLGLGDTLAARELQLQLLENAVRRFGSDSPQTVPFRYRLASYYNQSRMRTAAREQYEQVVATLEAQPESGDEALLPPLRQLLRIEMLLGDKEEARARIVDILDTHPDISASERGKSLAALGDWAIVQEDVPTAVAYYGEAYELLRREPAEFEAEFGEPAMLDFIAPLSAVDLGRRSDPYSWGQIVLQFEVFADGRAANVETLAAEPPGVMDDAYNRRIRETHFRPRMVDGVPQQTTDVRFTHQFRYYVED